MKGIKLELLGVAVILSGIALSTNNFFAMVCGAAGTLLALIGCLWKD